MLAMEALVTEVKFTERDEIDRFFSCYLATRVISISIQFGEQPTIKLIFCHFSIRKQIYLTIVQL